VEIEGSLQWFGHVIETYEIRAPKTILERKPECGRIVARSQLRWTEYYFFSFFIGYYDTFGRNFWQPDRITVPAFC
jgi:hypothetical protein